MLEKSQGISSDLNDILQSKRNQNLLDRLESLSNRSRKLPTMVVRKDKIRFTQQAVKVDIQEVKKDQLISSTDKVEFYPKTDVK